VGDRRRPVAVAAAARGDGKEGVLLGSARPWEILWVLGSVLGSLGCHENGRKRGCSGGGGIGGVEARWRAEGRRTTLK
jgi:hypothetical protein